MRVVVKTHIMRATLSARGTEGLVTAFPGRSPSEVTVISALGFPKYLLSRRVKATLPLRWFEVAVQGSRTPELGSPGRWCQGPSRRGHRASEGHGSVSVPTPRSLEKVEPPRSAPF